ncbi:MAG: glycine/sarcosine/betaine reductase selenoprotein B family protein [Betaproteobacteria bacterium]
MARLSDLTEHERDHLLSMRDQAPRLEPKAFVRPGPLSEARVAIISTAGLHQADDPAFAPGEGATGYRVIPGDVNPATLMMSHISVNFDRSGFRRDSEVVFPLARLRELAQEGRVGSVADFHYSFMGAPFPPTRFETKAREIAGLLRRDRVDAAVLMPV